MRFAVGLSGGVDSAVTALLLKERGEEVIGVTMSLGRPREEEMVSEARSVAKRIGIALHVIDFAGAWRERVLEYVRSTYRAGRTPNPCIRCNEFVKFGLLPRWAFAELHCDKFATGHYARIIGGRLFRGVDRGKDQSYFLYRVDSEVLGCTEFPIGALTKVEVREVARDAGFEDAERGESQDFCGGDVSRVVGGQDREGRVLTVGGRVIGTHRGFWHYTIGQRKGLGIGGGKPYYIVGIDAARNEVIVGFREDAVCRGLELSEVVGEPDFDLPVKVRSAGEPRFIRDGIIGVAPGQSAVFYRGDEVVGGGVIASGRNDT